MLLGKLLASRQLAGWLGQGVVSAANFVVLLVVAKWGGMAELGYYSLGFSVVAMTMAAQDSLVTRPYAIQLFKPPGGPGAHAYGTLVFGLALSAVIGAALLGAAGLLYATEADPQLAAVFLVLSLATPLVLARDFARRFCFANLQMHRALGLDIGASLLLLAAVMAVAFSGTLSASTTLLCYGAAGGIACAAWFAGSRHAFTRVPGASRASARQSWKLGKWLLLSQMAIQLQGYAAQWLILVMAGAVATGVYTACLSVVNLSNPFIFGILNFLTPKYVRVRNGAGDRGLRPAVFRDTLLITGVMTIFALALYFAGDMLLVGLFPSIVTGHGPAILALLAAAAAAGAAGSPATIALSAAERGPLIAVLSFASFIAGSVAVILLLPVYGLLGAALGMLLVEVLGAAARLLLFLRATSSPAGAGKPALARNMQ